MNIQGNIPQRREVAEFLHQIFDLQIGLGGAVHGYRFQLNTKRYTDRPVFMHEHRTVGRSDD
jgi:hypothetical protein